MHIICVAVGAGVHGQDGLERRRLQHGHLNGGEAAVADAPHAHAAIAPRLRRQPRHHIKAIQRLGSRVLVQRHAGAAARAAHIHAAARKAALRQVTHARMVGLVAPVIFAVRDHLQYRRKALRCGLCARQPQVG